MSNEKFQIININKETDYEGWLNFRLRGVGASEVGTLLGLNPYKSKIELFYQKLGFIPLKQDENLAMFYGSRLEDFVANMWQYYDNDAESVIGNFNTEVKKRFCKPVPGYVLNADYPNLFFSPDRIITKGETDRIVYNGNLVTKNIHGVLEIKTISGFASKQWEGGIPPSYIIQLTTYMIGLETSYGEIVLLEDGRKLTVLPVERNEAIVTEILSAIQDFTDRVEAARADIENVHLYEPEPDGTQAFESFLNQRYANSEIKTLQGTPELLEIAINHKKAQEEGKRQDVIVREYSNQIKNYMKEHEALDFGLKGKIVWKTDARGTRALRNNVIYGE